jgi:leader peptidase (prepilin peptidase)/N-methyltransferase
MWFFLFLAAMLGASLGSFASVLIARSDNPRSVMFATGSDDMARSACPNCGRVLTAMDLLPLFGWILAGGKCRSCKTPIGWRYLVYEIIGAGVLALSFWHNGFGVPFVLLIFGLPFVIAVAGLLYQRKSIPPIYQIGALLGGIALVASM